MQKAGCLNYSLTPWELDKDGIYVRQICYKFDKCVSRYRGEAVSTQQRSLLPDRNGWVIEEVLTLHGVPLGDHFNLHFRYQIEHAPSKGKACHICVYFGIAWLKSTRHQKRISKNIHSNLQDRLKLMVGEVEKEFLTGK
ncbi:C2 and GRAM domain-containing protein [Vitis vinifera]|nr:C2 and GRAM domain-containing protein [Vitis vinifera]